MEIKFLKRKKVFKKGNSEINPDLYWKIIFCISFIIIVSSFVFSFFLFQETNKDLVLPIVNTNEQNIIKKERIEKVLEYFSEREGKSAKILNLPSPVVDPSL